MIGAPDGRHRAARAIFALAVAVVCLGSVAFAATRPDRDRPQGQKKGQRHQSRGERPPRPRFIEVPPVGGVDPDAQFRFHVEPRNVAPAEPGPSRAPAPPAVRWRQFQCRLDGGEWSSCSSPRRLTDLEPGEHSFAVRALNRRGLAGLAAHYRWSQREPMEFTVELLGSLQPLMPGDPPQPLPVRISNPNPVPIEVVGLTFSVAPGAPGCVADPNFAIFPSSLAPSAPLGVPAGGSVSLPSPGATAPALALRELAADQNACQGSSVQLHFSGQARG
ncbi:MAG TPA: hypothetical protein VFU16_01135 [Solirubrobacterales bacterium]|nr:hypothetical protein [Solirubrobacterales bacterium]